MQLQYLMVNINRWRQNVPQMITDPDQDTCYIYEQCILILNNICNILPIILTSNYNKKSKYGGDPSWSVHITYCYVA